MSRLGLQVERGHRRDVVAVRGDDGSGGRVDEERRRACARVRDRVAEVQRDVLVPDGARSLRDEDGRVQVGVSEDFCNK